ncbi:MAG TPA: hypothetical protein VGS23_02630 [Thermoplasmata archaeon]|nr:hypothetical protein [Thermoplasmata archaeon]
MGASELDRRGRPGHDRVGGNARLSKLTLQATWRELKARRARAWVAAIAVPYALVSMLVGQMLTLEPIGGASTVTLVTSGSGGPWWDYPELVLVQSWGFAVLPWFPTLTMIAVSAGVGVGGAMGILLVRSVLASRVPGVIPRAAGGLSAGVSPAITGVATLGACCCTGCVGATGLPVVAAVSGAPVGALLLNNWYLGVFQLVVVYVALLAQERAIRRGSGDATPVPRLGARFVAGAILRVGLLIAGTTWSLAMFVEWTQTSPISASPALWYHWVFEHQLLALTAIAAGLFPEEFSSALDRWGRRSRGRSGRAALGIAGATWGIGVPPVLVGLGLGGLVNEVLGVLGSPASWGAIPPDAPLGAPLYFHWVFQHSLLAAFALLTAAAPERSAQVLRWTTGDLGPSAAQSSFEGRRPTRPLGAPEVAAEQLAGSSPAVRTDP